MTDPDAALETFLATRFNQDSLRKIAQEWHEERTGMSPETTGCVMDGELFARNVLNLTGRFNDMQARLDDAADTIASLEADRATWRDEAEAALRQVADLTAERVRLLAHPPAVAPLGPGETVTIPDAGAFDEAAIEIVALKPDGRWLSLCATSWTDRAVVYLDAAGVRALRDVCSRFLATQEGDDGPE